MLLDTTFFIDLAEELQARQPGACHALLDATRHRTRRASVVTIGEFAIGSTEAETRRFFRGYVPVPLGREDAIFCGGLQRSLRFQMGENDLWIAGIALRHGFHLATRDRAFARVPGLKVIPY
jgi:predicted nucleic acid-binding protein